MLRNGLLAIHLSLVIAANPALAQRGGPARGDSGDQVPAAGTMMPIVTVLDEQGESFSTASLKGSYTVLVFGCLT